MQILTVPIYILMTELIEDKDAKILQIINIPLPGSPKHHSQCLHWAYPPIMLVRESVSQWVRPSNMSRNLVNVLQSKYCLQPCATLVHSSI